ncbi:hypothetical protein [Apibacter sp. HY039]|uniref:hypothetical protein n=1 Tax=Apibacter sp. HY039 TaxID=2501476 RepID=UPI000FEBC8D4|nr:hypothetical protein [Apibacter sp. HY039]
MQEPISITIPFSGFGQMHEYRIKSTIRNNVTLKSPKDKVWVRDIGIIFTGREEEGYRFQVFCLKVEDRSASAPIYSLEKTKFRLFDDVRISVSAEGEIKKLNNLSTIQKRWKEMRRELEKINQGDSVQNYFNSIDQLLEDKQKIINFLSDYVMLGLFFNGTVFGNLAAFTENKKTVAPEFLLSTRIEELWKKQNTQQQQNEIYFSVKGQAIDPAKPQQKDLLKKYEGTFIYEGNRLIDAGIETHYNNHFRKHTLLWTGLTQYSTEEKKTIQKP